MIKISVLFIFAVLAATNAQSSNETVGLFCPRGTIVWSADKGHIVSIVNYTTSPCPLGHHCAMGQWFNTDPSGFISYIEYGFCLNSSQVNELEYYCPDLPGSEPTITKVANCSFSACNTSNCKSFYNPGPLSDLRCQVGTTVYTGETYLKLSSNHAEIVRCPVGYECGTYNFQQLVYGTYVEHGLCVNTEYKSFYTCDSLKDFVEGEVSNCSFHTCNATTCGELLEVNKRIECFSGLVRYNDRHQVVYENTTTSTCQPEEVCFWSSYWNSSSNEYIEGAGCAISGNLSDVENVHNQFLLGDLSVSDLTTSACGTSRCVRFSVIPPNPNCPPKVSEDDIQVLPNCTMKQILNKTFECQASIAAQFPFSNETVCRDTFDQMIACMSDFASTCFAYKEDYTPCDAELNIIPDIVNIYHMIPVVAQQIRSVREAVDIIYYATNGSVDLNMLYGVCGNATQREQLLTMLSNLPIDLIPDQIRSLRLPFCNDNKVIGDLITWGLDMAKGYLGATTRTDICYSFSKIKTRLTDLLTNRCDVLKALEMLQSLVPDIGPYAHLIEKAADILLEYMYHLELPNCQKFDFLICNLGDMIYTEGMTFVYDINATADVCPPNTTCGMAKFFNRINGSTGFVESGYCSNVSNVGQIKCPNLTEYGVKGEWFNCTNFLCGTSRCAKFKGEDCPAMAEDDIPLLPQCSAETTLTKAFDCLGPFMGDYPYNDRGMCRSRVDGIIQCLSKEIQTCLPGNCPTILDAIDPNLRKIYREIMYYAKKIQSVNDLVGLFGLDIDQTTLSLIDSMICPTPGTSFPSMITDALAQVLPYLDEVQFGMCNDGFLKEIVGSSITFAKDMFEARDHMTVCNAFSSFKQSFEHTWNKHKCEFDKLYNWLAQNRIPHEYAELIVKGSKMVLGFMEQLEIPNCDEMSLPDCSQMFDTSTSCGVRRAWVCDYISWKVGFMTTWLKQFYSYANMMGMPIASNLPGCAIIEARGMCRHPEMQRCRSTPDGCSICFCQDHDYIDLTRIMGLWKRDYENWRKVMYVYNRMVMPTGGECNM